jgi:hypothetical protein
MFCHFDFERDLTFELCDLSLLWHSDSSHKVSLMGVACAMIVKAGTNVGREVCYEIQGEY